MECVCSCYPSHFDSDATVSAKSQMDARFFLALHPLPALEPALYITVGSAQSWTQYNPGDEEIQRLGCLALCRPTSSKGSDKTGYEPMASEGGIDIIRAAMRQFINNSGVQLGRMCDS